MTRNIYLTFLIVSLFLLGYFFQVARLSNIFSPDFIVYLEALLRLSSFESFNPYIHSRGVNIFSDHQDFILYPVSLLFYLLGKRAESLVLIEWLFFLSIPISVVYLSFKNVISTKVSLLMIFLYLTSPILLDSLRSMAHPTAWSAPVFFFIGISLYRKDWNNLYLLSISSLVFKEVFLINFLGLAIIWLIQKKYIKLTSTLIISFFFLALRYYLKADPQYTNVNYIQQIFTFLERDYSYDIFIFLYLFLSNYFSLYFLFATLKFQKLLLPSLEAYIYFLTWLPYITIHFLLDRSSVIGHYGSPLAAFFLGYVLFSNLDALSRYLKIFLMTSSIYLGLPFYSLFLNNYWKLKGANIQFEEKYHKEIFDIRARIKKLPKDTFIYSRAGILHKFIDMKNYRFRAIEFSYERPYYTILSKNLIQGSYPYADRLQKCLIGNNFKFEGRFFLFGIVHPNCSLAHNSQPIKVVRKSSLFKIISSLIKIGN